MPLMARGRMSACYMNELPIQKIQCPSCTALSTLINAWLFSDQVTRLDALFIGTQLGYHHAPYAISGVMVEPHESAVRNSYPPNFYCPPCAVSFGVLGTN